MESNYITAVLINTLFCSYVKCKYGLPNTENITNVESDLNFVFDFENISNRLTEFAHAHEMQDNEGDYKDYVNACLSSTTKKPQRTIRFKILTSIFKGI